MDTKELLAKVRKIEIKTRRLSNHLFSGEYHTSFKGRGMTFAEVRPYQFGDDVRAIDWNVTARFNEPFVKVFEEERELTLMMMVDVSASKLFGTTNQTKSETVAEIVATLAFSATQNNDKIGLILFTDQIELYIPPKKGKSHVLRIIRELLEFQPKSKKTNIRVPLEFLAGVQKKKAIVFLVSDFIDHHSYDHALKMTGKKHDVTGIKIYDPKEQKFPDVGLVLMQDAETGASQWVNTGYKKVRVEFEKFFASQQQKFQDSFNKAGCGSITINLQDSYVKKLLGYFKARN